MSHPVHSEWIGLPTPAGTMAAFLALPPGGRGPGLLLVQEIFGVNEHIREVAQQYALAGFVVLAPDVFWRQAPRVELGYEGADREHGMQLASALVPTELQADLMAALAALRARPEVRARADTRTSTHTSANTGANTKPDAHPPAKIGVIGFCMGGRLAYNAAALGGVDAAVAYYGGGIQQQLGQATQVNCPIQFHYGESDRHIPPEAVEAVRSAFAGREAEVYVYPGSDHGFNCWARASYHAPSAALALGRSLQFLAQHLF